jgi:3-phosphoshikimate 1-carboxyvinyltransferase
MDFLTIAAAARAAGTVQLPGSKSISNRTLLLAALARGETRVTGLLASDDTAVMLDALKTLGVAWSREGASDKYRVSGIAAAHTLFPTREAALFMGNAGTAIRPLTAALAISGGTYTLSGVPRMHERPIGDLVDGLRELGLSLEYLGNPGFPPLKISPAKVRSHSVSVRGDVSSQFLTALLMAAPIMATQLGQPVTISVVGELISKPYIDITLKLMAQFGVQVAREGWSRFTLPQATYQSPGVLAVEGDASSASYFMAAGAIAAAAENPVRIEGVGAGSIQGDIRFAETVEMMGGQLKLGVGFVEVWNPAPAGAPRAKLKAIDADFNHIPDAAMTVAVMALFADGACTLRNIASWRVKETDRLAAMATELRKVGAVVEEGADYLRVTPPAALTPHAAIDTYDDHRMAMCFSLAALGGVPVRINDPKCVGKTFPTYFDVFQGVVR